MGLHRFFFSFSFFFDGRIAELRLRVFWMDDGDGEKRKTALVG
jgi:hypothetical protein